MSGVLGLLKRGSYRNGTGVGEVGGDENRFLSDSGSLHDPLSLMWHRVW